MGALVRANPSGAARKSVHVRSSASASPVLASACLDAVVAQIQLRGSGGGDIPHPSGHPLMSRLQSVSTSSFGAIGGTGLPAPPHRSIASSGTYSCSHLWSEGATATLDQSDILYGECE